MTNNKEYVIYTRWLAAELREQGFRLIRVGVNKNFPQFNTFVFEDCEDLHIAMKQLSKRKQR